MVAGGNVPHDDAGPRQRLCARRCGHAAWSIASRLLPAFIGAGEITLRKDGSGNGRSWHPLLLARSAAAEYSQGIGLFAATGGPRGAACVLPACDFSGACVGRSRVVAGQSRFSPQRRSARLTLETQFTPACNLLTVNQSRLRDSAKFRGKENENQKHRCNSVVCLHPDGASHHRLRRQQSRCRGITDEER